MKRRFFNRSEKAALYIAADGKCSSCGVDLGLGWHADHVIPHSKGGATDLLNGSALCAACNLRKGSKTIMTELRPWQQEALANYLHADKQDFLAVACPGAGKTTWALTLAKTLIDRGDIRRVIVVVPSDALRTQWSDHTAAGVDLRPYVSGPIDKSGYHGVVTTYQSLCGVAAGVIRQAIGGDDTKRTLVILDEIHHAADTSSYGQSLGFAFEHASRRLSLTGTPWRTDARERMPFVDFDESGMLRVDYAYDYGDAVGDGVCRRIDFPVVDAQASWVRDLERREESLTVNRRLTGIDRTDSLRAILDPSATGKWFADVLVRAHQDLQSMRREIPDAGGLIVAKDKIHAKKIAKRLRDLTGIDAPVVVSAEDEGGSNGDARATIERFRDSRDPWIIAVKMIAEGVDIPRLVVGVYATNVSTSMFFNQVVGRFVRIRPGEQVTSRLYVPPSFHLWAIVREIQRMLPQRLEDPIETRRTNREGSGLGSVESEFSYLSSESSGLSLVRTHDGDVQGDLITNWTNFLDERGIPTHYATQAASSGSQPPAKTAVIDRPVPTHRREKELRDEINVLAGRVAYACYGDHTAKKKVRQDLFRIFGCGVDDLSVGDLERCRDILEQALEAGDRL